MSNEKISFTETEVSELTGLKIKTLQRWRFLNQGPRFVRLGRCVRYPAAALHQWVNDQSGGGGQPSGASLRHQENIVQAEPMHAGIA